MIWVSCDSFIRFNKDLMWKTLEQFFVYTEKEKKVLFKPAVHQLTDWQTKAQPWLITDVDDGMKKAKLKQGDYMVWGVMNNKTGEAMKAKWTGKRGKAGQNTKKRSRSSSGNRFELDEHWTLSKWTERCFTIEDLVISLKYKIQWQLHKKLPSQ